MHLGIDVFWLALPPAHLDLARVRPEYYTWASVVEADGLDWFTVHPGPILDPGHACPSPRDQGLPGRRHESDRRRRDLEARVAGGRSAHIRRLSGLDGIPAGTTPSVLVKAHLAASDGRHQNAAQSLPARGQARVQAQVSHARFGDPA